MYSSVASDMSGRDFHELIAKAFGARLRRGAYHSGFLPCIRMSVRSVVLKFSSVPLLCSLRVLEFLSSLRSPHLRTIVTHSLTKSRRRISKRVTCRRSGCTRRWGGLESYIGLANAVANSEAFHMMTCRVVGVETVGTKGDHTSRATPESYRTLADDTTTREGQSSS